MARHIYTGSDGETDYLVDKYDTGEVGLSIRPTEHPDWTWVPVMLHFEGVDGR